jgi:hypothetical protein
MVAEWIPERALGFPAGYAVSGILRGFLWLLRDDSSIGQPMRKHRSSWIALMVFAAAVGVAAPSRGFR